VRGYRLVPSPDVGYRHRQSLSSARVSGT